MRLYSYYLAGLLLAAPALAQERVFSGPQPGEKLPNFKMKGVVGPRANQEVDLVAEAGEGPVLLIFFHERTRPAFGLANTLTRFAASRSDKKLTAGVCFLTNDSTATENWLKLVTQHLTKEIPHGVSLDGLEGPGAYGLNRNVALTILVGVGGKVSANFALVQPSVQADGPKIVKAVVEASGGGDVPDIGKFAPARYRRARDDARDPKLTGLVRALIAKDASKEDVEKAAQEVEEYVAQNRKARNQLGEIAERVVNSGRLNNYGTARAQEFLKEWAKEYGRSSTKRSPRPKK